MTSVLTSVFCIYLKYVCATDLDVLHNALWWYIRGQAQRLLEDKAELKAELEALKEDAKNMGVVLHTVLLLLRAHERVLTASTYTSSSTSYEHAHYYY
jgi:hypothetical protein